MVQLLLLRFPWLGTANVQNLVFGIIVIFLPGASSSSKTLTLALRLMGQMLYHCVTATVASFIKPFSRRISIFCSLA